VDAPLPRIAPRIPGKRAQTREQNRRTILDAARRVFAELGYGPATVRDIIRATPLASGTFYNYFSSKEEVFQAIRDETAAALRPMLREARAKAETLDAFIAGTFRTFFAHIAENRAGLTGVPRHQGHVQVDAPEVLAGLDELKEDLEAAVARGLLTRVDVGFLSAAMVGVAFELAEAMQKRQPLDPEAATRFATALITGGIAGLPPAAV
jgi:AcrR family transcriptional regulator